MIIKKERINMEWIGPKITEYIYRYTMISNKKWKYRNSLVVSSSRLRGEGIQSAYYVNLDPKKREK